MDREEGPGGEETGGQGVEQEVRRVEGPWASTAREEERRESRRQDGAVQDAPATLPVPELGRQEAGYRAQAVNAGVGEYLGDVVVEERPLKRPEVDAGGEDDEKDEVSGFQESVSREPFSSSALYI